MNMNDLQICMMIWNTCSVHKACKTSMAKTNLKNYNPSIKF